MEDANYKIFFPDTNPPIPLLHDFYKSIPGLKLNLPETASTTNNSGLDETDDSCCQQNENSKTVGDHQQAAPTIATKLTQKVMKVNDGFITNEIVKEIPKMMNEVADKNPQVFRDLTPISFDSSQHIRDNEERINKSSRC